MLISLLLLRFPKFRSKILFSFLSNSTTRLTVELASLLLYSVIDLIFVEDPSMKVSSVNGIIFS